MEDTDMFFEKFPISTFFPGRLNITGWFWWHNWPSLPPVSGARTLPTSILGRVLSAMSQVSNGKRMRHFPRLNGFVHIGGSKMKPVDKQMVCLDRSQHVMDLFGQMMKTCAARWVERKRNWEIGDPFWWNTFWNVDCGLLKLKDVKCKTSSKAHFHF